MGAWYSGSRQVQHGLSCTRINKKIKYLREVTQKLEMAETAGDYVWQTRCFWK